MTTTKDRDEAPAQQSADPLDRTILPIPPQRKLGKIGPPLQPVTHDGALFVNSDAIKYVEELVPASTGQRYLPHVRLGTATRTLSRRCRPRRSTSLPSAA